jgi:putative endonuclease
MECYVYALYNRKVSKIYIGQTDDVRRRTEEHNNKQGKHFTTQVEGKWIVIYQEKCISRSEALKREKQLKSYRGREFIKSLIKIEDSAPL